MHVSSFSTRLLIWQTKMSLQSALYYFLWFSLVCSGADFKHFFSPAMNEMKPQLQVHVCIFCRYDQVKARLSSLTLNLKGFVPVTIVNAG